MAGSSDLIAIDIGSRNICAYAAEPLSDDAFAVKTSCEMEYDGYSEGKWVNPNNTIDTVLKFLDKIERTVGTIKTVYIGIPADFCIVRTIYDKVSFPKRKRIMPSDLDELYETNDPFAETDSERIAISPILFLDDRGERLPNPIGHVTSLLKARVSYIGAKRAVLNMFREELYRRGIKKIHFIASEYAAARALFTPEELDGGIILADIGYKATSVLHFVGGALVEMRTFALGGSLIPMGLSARFDFPHRVASAFVPKINLGYKDNGDYSLKYDASTYVCSVEAVNEMTKECIDCLALYLGRAIKSFKYEVSAASTIYVTGGGLCEVRLARDYLSKSLGRKVEFVHPVTPNFAKPYFSTAVGVIREAMAIRKKERFGFLKKLFNI